MRVLLLWAIILLAVGGLMKASGFATQADSLAAIQADGWQMNAGDAGTGCALGGPCHFFARTVVNAAHVILYFQAGGGVVYPR